MEGGVDVGGEGGGGGEAAGAVAAGEGGGDAGGGADVIVSRGIAADLLGADATHRPHQNDQTRPGWGQVGRMQEGLDCLTPL